MNKILRRGKFELLVLKSKIKQIKWIILYWIVKFKAKCPYKHNYNGCIFAGKFGYCSLKEECPIAEDLGWNE